MPFSWLVTCHIFISCHFKWGQGKRVGHLRQGTHWLEQLPAYGAETTIKGVSSIRMQLRPAPLGREEIRGEKAPMEAQLQLWPLWVASLSCSLGNVERWGVGNSDLQIWL